MKMITKDINPLVSEMLYFAGMAKVSNSKKAGVIENFPVSAAHMSLLTIGAYLRLYLKN